MENGKANSGSNPKARPRVVVVGSGFAGFTCARELERRLRPEDASLAVAERTGIYATPPVPLEEERSARGRVKGANR